MKIVPYDSNCMSPAMKLRALEVGTNQTKSFFVCLFVFLYSNIIG